MNTDSIVLASASVNLIFDTRKGDPFLTPVEEISPKRKWIEHEIFPAFAHILIF